MLLMCCTGCTAHWCHLPDDFANAFNQTQLGWELHDVCRGRALGSCGCGEGLDCSCGMRVYDDAVYLEEPELARRPRIKAGPPPERYEPPMPPKFLPVPVSSVWGVASGR